MDHDITVEDYKEYVYVISYYSPSNVFVRSDLMNTDISIFEIDEWEDLLHKSEMFKKWVDILNRESDIEHIKTHPEIKSATYYLYHNCDYNKYSDFSSFEYYTGNSQNIYKRVFLETKNKDRYNVSINNFREWISDNYERFNTNYNILHHFSLETPTLEGVLSD